MNTRLLLCAVLAAFGLVFAGNKFIKCNWTKSSLQKHVKMHEFAGAFYPEDKVELQSVLETFFDNVEPQDSGNKIIGLIAPHAGYQYSGAVTAHAFKAVVGQQYDAVVLLAFTHKRPERGIAVYPSGEFTTPLGPLAVDKLVAKRLLELKFAWADTKVFTQEHSLEVQLPFVVKSLGSVKIVPIFVGSLTGQEFESLAKALVDLSLKKRILVIASTDLSHYLLYNEAVARDFQTVSLIQNLDAQALLVSRDIDEGRACGINPLLALLYYTKAKGAKIRVLKYANSGDSAGGKNSVVGYVSAVAEESVPAKEIFSPQDKANLLFLARNTLEIFLKTGQRTAIAQSTSQVLSIKMGAFVTLKNKNGELRGCIGHIAANKPVSVVVQDCVISAAVDDPRFLPVDYHELQDISIELSLLSPLVLVTDFNEIVVGRDGLLIKLGLASGLLLPQVAVENSWNRETFLEQVCVKAGLPKDSYRSKSAVLQRFSAIVFHEK